MRCKRDWWWWWWQCVSREPFQCLDFNENHTLSSQLIIYLMQTWLAGTFPCSLPRRSPKKVGKINLALLSRQSLWFGVITPKASLLTSLLRWKGTFLIIFPIDVLHWHFTHILRLWSFLVYANETLAIYFQRIDSAYSFKVHLNSLL